MINKIPFAGDPSVDPNEKIELSLDNKPILEERIKTAMRTFQRWYRSLEADVRYGVEMLIKQKVCKDLSLTEMEAIMSRFQAAMKGWNGPEDKNQ